MTDAGPRAVRLTDLAAITFDFGNTLVRVDRAGLRQVVELTASEVCAMAGIDDVARFLAAWAQERERQFREDVPRFREVDLGQRVVRVIARCRGMPPPPPDIPWDDEAAARRSTADEVAFAVDVYSRAFVAGLPPSPSAGPLLGRLRAHGLRLAILSNWPLAATIDRYAEAAGWTPLLDAIVVSQRVGTIKPHPAMFAAAAAALGDPPASRTLHVGDDWTADIEGAKGVGWLAAYLHGGPDDSPLPSSRRRDGVQPDLELRALDELEARLG